MDRHELWSSAYGKLARAGNNRRGYDYTPEAYAIFPRYNVLHAIQREVETLDFDHLPRFDELHELLIIVGKSAANDFTGNHENAIARAAEQEEREFFVDAIHNAIANDMFEQTPLHYRRTLTKPEVDELWRRLRGTWGMTGNYWYPLDSKSHPSLIALELDRIDRLALQRRIKKFFKANGVRRLWELREFGGESCCVEAGRDDLNYDGGGEGYWTSDANDWIVYCSHERTMTLGGTIAAIATPDLNRHT